MRIVVEEEAALALVALKISSAMEGTEPQDLANLVGVDKEQILRILSADESDLSIRFVARCATVLGYRLDIQFIRNR